MAEARVAIGGGAQTITMVSHPEEGSEIERMLTIPCHLVGEAHPRMREGPCTGCGMRWSEEFRMFT
jgi:hypothetical protein